MYGLTEKILMLFPFYRESVRVMDSYALRLSEAVDALKATCDERDALREQVRSEIAMTTARRKDLEQANELTRLLFEDISKGASGRQRAEEDMRAWKFRERAELLSRQHG